MSCRGVWHLPCHVDRGGQRVEISGGLVRPLQRQRPVAQQRRGLRMAGWYRPRGLAEQGGRLAQVGWAPERIAASFAAAAKPVSSTIFRSAAG